MTQVKPLRLVQITDCHLFADVDTQSHGDINPYQSLKSVLSMAARFAPDRVLLTGDLSSDLSRQSYLHLQGLWLASGVSAPLDIVPGNHDEPTLFEELFSRHMTWLDEPVVMGNWCLHGLNSQHEGTLGRVGEPQLSRLEQHIMRRPDLFHLVAVHHHPKPCNSWLDNHPWTNSEDFLALLERQQGIRLVLHGHVHADLRWQVGQTAILACPSTCWQWQQSEYFSLADETAGLRLLELSADGTFETRVERLDAASFWP
ncbi:metallophosphoesterase family protein [Bowmanella dokdonensis]|uniref:Metallophosphoesterase n=1 Tax=Bowmanella dokdonensis TaxID=751969 RepID=A0A939DQ02_9ALTE|nr:metallophosphoesterase [Bowmanella dokdonensis]MBN7826629.1 metallophosphoesterase [Bowmanella dokdonensis]